MTIRGGGDPAVPHGFQTALKNGPAAPELRRDAHDCIMVVILTDQPNTRLRGKSAPDRELPSELSLLAPHDLARPTQPAAVLVTVKGTSPRDGLRSPLDRPCARRPIKVRSAPRDRRQLVEQGDGKDRRLA